MPGWADKSWQVNGWEVSGWEGSGWAGPTPASDGGAHWEDWTGNWEDQDDRPWEDQHV